MDNLNSADLQNITRKKPKQLKPSRQQADEVWFSLPPWCAALTSLDGPRAPRDAALPVGTEDGGAQAGQGAAVVLGAGVIVGQRDAADLSGFLQQNTRRVNGRAKREKLEEEESERKPRPHSLTHPLQCGVDRHVDVLVD